MAILFMIAADTAHNTDLYAYNITETVEIQTIIDYLTDIDCEELRASVV